jgi:hypothetical protein
MENQNASGFVTVAILLFLSIPSHGRAAIVLSIEQGVSFEQGSGIREVNVLARSTDPTADRLYALSIDLTVKDAVFSFVSQEEFNADNYDPDPLSPTFGQWFTSGPRYTKLFNESDYVGFGNLNKQGGSYLQFNTKIEGGVPVPDPSTAALSLEFESPQTFPDSDTPLAKLRLDITNLVPGEYPIGFAFVFADGTLMAEIPSRSSDGFFTILAVPEPNTLSLVVGTWLGALLTRRRSIAAR